MNRREKLTLGVAAAAVALPLMTIPHMALADDSTVSITQTQVTTDGTAQETLSEGMSSLVKSDGTVTVTKVEKTTESDTAEPAEQVDEEGKQAGDTAQQHDDSQEGQEAEEETTNTGKVALPLKRMVQTKVVQKTTTEQASVTSNQVAVTNLTANTGQTTTADTTSQNSQTPTARHMLMRTAVTSTSTTAAKTAAAKTRTLASGLYEIQAGTNGGLRMDVGGGSTADGGAVQTWGDNATAAQRWRVASVGGGWYTIQNVNSGKYLDVPAANARQGARLQQWAGNGTNAQRWAIVADAGRPGMWVIRTSLDSGLVVDVPGASKGSGARLQLWRANGTAAQSFAFSRVTQAVADGVYTISNVGSGRRLDVSGASLDDGGNVQQYAGNGTMAQSFRVRYDSSTGYYTIVSAQSGKVLDVSGAGSYDGANVQQYASNGTRAQRWAIESVGGGAWRIRSSIDGRALDVSGGSRASGANVQTYRWNGTNAQRWTLTRLSSWLPAGTYEVLSALNHSNALGVPDGTYCSASVATTGGAPLDPFRKWQLTGNGDGTWRIVNVGSGLALTMAGGTDGAPLRQQAWTGASGQRWALSVEVGGLLLRSALSPKVADVSGGSTRAGARVQAYASNGTYAQRFVARGTSLFATNQSYVIHAKADAGRVADVSGASTADGAAVQFYRSNGTMAQLYYVEDAGGGRVRIVNANSGKYLVPSQGGAGVTQSSARHSTASLWAITWDGAANGLRVTSVSTGRALEYGSATGSSSASAKLSAPVSGKASQAMLLYHSDPFGPYGNSETWITDPYYHNKYLGGITTKVRLMQSGLHNTPNRVFRGEKITTIVIHHNDGNLTTEGCWDTWQTRAASANYQVEANGTIGQLVRDSDIAWHAGNWGVNQRSIGIEHADSSRHPYRVSNATLESGAHLVGALCVVYKLGVPTWGVNVIGHNEASSTECPASLGRGGSQHDAYINRARQWYYALLNK